MSRWLALIGSSLFLLGAATPAEAEKRIALSFDDVPRSPGGFMAPDQRAIALIAGLQKAGVEQAGFFVTTGNLERSFGAGGEERIRAYAAAGHALANHSEAHGSLNRMTVEDYLADLDRAEAWLAGMPGKRPWFRFPFLHEGNDREKRDAVRSALAERGLKSAYVTIDNYDWAIDNLAKRAAESSRPVDRKALGDLFVETMVQAADFYDGIARKTLGRSPAHVLLLHETDLAALYIADLAQALRAAGWTIIPIDEAYLDPIAAMEPDTLFLGSGRVAAIAHVVGWKRNDLVHERTDEEVLAKMFEERVIEQPAQ